MNKNEKRDSLMSEIGKHLEETLHIPPLASRIYSLLIICGKDGHTFDEIVEHSQSSKSSVSTSLKLLLDAGYIEYFTPEGERKRFFKLSRNYLIQNLKKTQDFLASELDMFEKVNIYKAENQTDELKSRSEFRKIYINFIQEQQKIVEDTMEKMRNLD